MGKGPGSCRVGPLTLRITIVGYSVCRHTACFKPVITALFKKSTFLYLNPAHLLHLISVPHQPRQLRIIRSGTEFCTVIDFQEQGAVNISLKHVSRAHYSAQHVKIYREGHRPRAQPTIKQEWHQYLSEKHSLSHAFSLAHFLLVTCTLRVCARQLLFPQSDLV